MLKNRRGDPRSNFEDVKKEDTKRPFTEWSLHTPDRALTSIPLVDDDRLHETLAHPPLPFFLFSHENPDRTLQSAMGPFTRANLTLALIVKACCVGWRESERSNARAKGQGKGRESEKRLSEPAVWRRVPGDEGWSNPAGARARRERHVLFKVTGPPTPRSRPFAQRRPGALYRNSADRSSWLRASAWPSLRDPENTTERDCLASTWINTYFSTNLFGLRHSIPMENHAERRYFVNSLYFLRSDTRVNLHSVRMNLLLCMVEWIYRRRSLMRSNVRGIYSLKSIEIFTHSILTESDILLLSIFLVE